jgi:hypothetical protein
VDGEGEDSNEKMKKLLLYISMMSLFVLRSTPAMHDDYNSLALTKDVSKDEVDENWRR